MLAGASTALCPPVKQSGDWVGILAVLFIAPLTIYRATQFAPAASSSPAWFRAEEPILFYYWTPEWIHAAYHLVPLEEPDRTEGCEDLKLDQEDWLEASTFTCKYDDERAYVAYPKSLEQRNPIVVRFLSQIKLDAGVIDEWILSKLAATTKIPRMLPRPGSRRIRTR